MAERTVETGYFGAEGHGDISVVCAEKTIATSWDFGKTAVPENKTIPIMQLPKGFCIDRISVVQTKFADQSLALGFGLKSDTAKAVGGTFMLAASGTLLRSSQKAGTASGTVSGSNVTFSGEDCVFVDGDDVLCMIVPNNLTGDECAAGAFDVFIHGFSVFAEGCTENKTGNENYRKTLQTQDNVAGPRFPID